MLTGLSRFLLYLLTGGFFTASLVVAAWGFGRLDLTPEPAPAEGPNVLPPVAEGAQTDTDTEAEVEAPWTAAGADWIDRNLQGPLFDPPPVAAPPPPPPVPPPLVLRGTVAEGGPESRAFLAGPDGVVEVVGVGAEAEGAVLLTVEADHVVVSFQGVNHRLELTP